MEQVYKLYPESDIDRTNISKIISDYTKEVDRQQSNTLREAFRRIGYSEIANAESIQEMADLIKGHGIKAELLVIQYTGEEFLRIEKNGETVFFSRIRDGK